jgi:deoxycytidylate deaminase
MITFNNELLAKIGSDHHHHYCVITYGGKVITTGYNRPYGFISNGKNYMRHAECDALLKLPEKYKNKKLRLCVVRKGYKNSKPCQKCLEFISEYRVKNIYYSDEGCLWDEPQTTIQNSHRSFVYYQKNEDEILIKNGYIPSRSPYTIFKRT